MSDKQEAPKGGMDKGLLGGILLGFGSVIAGMYIEGSAIQAYMVKSAAIIVFGGTMGATMASVGLDTFKRMPQSFKRALNYMSPDRTATISTLTAFAEKARREGLLVLEDDLQRLDDEFLRKGVQLVVDGTDPELVKEILSTEVDALAETNGRDAGTWVTAGGFSPTLGIIGTVMGLVLVLQNLTDVQALGPAIAVAFVATFYGVAFANLLYLPIGNKLKLCSADEIQARELMIEGILAIQSGDNPRIVEEKLIAYLEPVDRVEYLTSKGGGADEFDLAA